MINIHDQCLTAGMNDFLSKAVTKTRVLSILKNTKEMDINY